MTDTTSAGRAGFGVMLAFPAARYWATHRLCVQSKICESRNQKALRKSSCVIFWFSSCQFCGRNIKFLISEFLRTPLNKYDLQGKQTIVRKITLNQWKQSRLLCETLHQPPLRPIEGQTATLPYALPLTFPLIHLWGSSLTYVYLGFFFLFLIFFTCFIFIWNK